MKIVIIGATGQVGSELTRAASIYGEVIPLSRDKLDLLNINKIIPTLNELNPDIIFNASAFTAVDRAETEIDTALVINSLAVKKIAEYCNNMNAWLIHYSTDYVYDGNKIAPYIETDDCNPKNIYGISKLKGENIIKNSGCNYLILRTSWVYSLIGNNFPKTILKLAKERESLSIVNDQYGSPTSAELIADISVLFINKITSQQVKSDTFHLTASGETNWYEFTKYLINEAKNYKHLKLKTIIEVSTSEYPTTAQRPLNSVLNTNKIENFLKITIPPWHTHAKRLIQQLFRENNE